MSMNSYTLWCNYATRVMSCISSIIVWCCRRAPNSCALHILQSQYSQSLYLNVRCDATTTLTVVPITVVAACRLGCCCCLCCGCCADGHCVPRPGGNILRPRSSAWAVAAESRVAASRCDARALRCPFSLSLAELLVYLFICHRSCACLILAYCDDSVRSERRCQCPVSTYVSEVDSMLDENTTLFMAYRGCNIRAVSPAQLIHVYWLTLLTWLRNLRRSVVCGAE